MSKARVEVSYRRSSWGWDRPDIKERILAHDEHATVAELNAAGFIVTNVREVGISRTRLEGWFDDMTERELAAI